jgi:dTDP-4-dehydrorhamnose reductase
MIDSLYEGKKMQLFEDEFRTPVLVHDVVATIEACLQLAIEAGEAGLSMADILSARGAGPCESPTLATFNIGGATRASRLDLGHALATAMELEDAAMANEVLAGERESCVCGLGRVVGCWAHRLRF